MTAPALQPGEGSSGPVGTRVDLDLTAALTDFRVIQPGTPIGATLVAKWPAGVTLEISYGGKDYIPFPSPEGKNLIFGREEVELKGARIRTTGVSANPGTLYFFACGTVLE